MHEDKRKLVIFISTIFIFLLIIVFVFILYFKDQLSSRSTDSITINNYSEYVKNLSSSEREAIESALYNTVLLNVSDKEKIKEITDAEIRENSYNQKLSQSIYSTVFIVDIESVKQSYEIQDLYSNLSVEKSGLTDYTSLAVCLDKNKLKYGEFDCKDRLSQESGVTQSDPILKYLPVSTLDYTIEQDISSKDLKLTAIITLTEIDYRSGSDQAIEKYKQLIKDWFTSKNLDINNYSITYKIN